MTAPSKLRLQELLQDRRGGVAIIFAVAACVLVASIGSAVDYARALGVASRLRNTVDGALLAAAPQAAEGTEALKLAFTSQMTANWGKGHHDSASPIIEELKTANEVVTASVNVGVPTLFMRVFGVNGITVNALSEVQVGAGDVEVALVLDNTGSMAGSRLSALKSAARSLVDIVYERPQAEKHVRVSVVPFSRYVNVGLDNRNASWMSVPSDSSEVREVCWQDYKVLSKSNCRTETVSWTEDGILKYGQTEACDYIYDTPVTVCQKQTSTSTWYGCVGSRSYPLNVRDGQYSTPIPGIMNATCTAPILPLTNSKSTLNSMIDGMIATGDTYIPAGLMWGWRTLSPDAPYDEAASYSKTGSNKRVRKILVLMTDGANTVSPTYPDHRGSDAVTANQLTIEACTAIKATGIEIYTIAFEVTDTTIQGVLQGCASAPGHYFAAVTEAQLRQAFESIAQGVVALRISR